ncbi:unknown [Blautia sp. CAG:257]|nr:unknown [Blautia sp. CAG:257]
MNITADSCLLSSYYKGDFTVSFQTYQAIDYVTAGLFQHFCPYNIIFLIKPGLQLHQNSNLLAVFRRLRQSRNDRRISADTIKRLLDGKDSRIFCSLPYKVHHRIKAHVRMMQENIAFTDHFKNIFVGLELRNRCRYILAGFIFFKAFQPIDLHKHSKIQRSRYAENILVSDIKLCFQDLKKTLIHFFFCFQTDNLSPLTFLQLFLDFHQKILRLVLINRKICVSHDPVRMGAYHIIAEKQLADISLNNLFQKDHSSDSLFTGRDLDHSWQYRGNLNCSKFQNLFPFLFVLLGDQRSDIQRFVPDQRKRPG